MFRVGETYTTDSNCLVLVIANDAPHVVGGVPCPVIGIITDPARKNTAIYCYNEKGWYCGVNPSKNSSYARYTIQSHEPNEDELKLIADLRKIIRDGAEDDLVLTRLIRQLRK